MIKKNQTDCESIEGRDERKEDLSYNINHRKILLFFSCSATKCSLGGTAVIFYASIK
jgi:hypothetical protein